MTVDMEKDPNTVSLLPRALERENDGGPMQKLSLYNTLTGKMEEFVPNVPGKITMYICGPTVYDSPHIGHARTYVSLDVMRRILSEYFGYDVTLVMNITDIDDKIIRRANERGIRCEELSSQYEDEFFAEMDKLGVRRPDFVTRVTEYVPECIRFIERLEEKCLTYTAKGSVYFDLEAYQNKFVYHLLRPYFFPYEPDNPQNGKKNRADFVLWKSSKSDEPAYEAKWGPGRPGWHIECSAMSTAIFGPKLDIHAGGVDLTFPHHENEIAQCQGYSGKHWANYILHTGHLNIDGLKMSKSLKNFLTVRNVLESASPSTLRILFLQHPWNKNMSFYREHLMYAYVVGQDIRNFLSHAESLAKRVDKRSLNELDLKMLKVLEGYKDAVHSHLANNLNTAKVLQEVKALISATHRHVQRLHSDVLGAICKFITRLMTIFGLMPESPAPASDIEHGLAEVLNEYRHEVRKAAKANSPASVFLELSDKVREQVRRYDYVMEDGRDGSVMRKEVKL